MVQSYGFSSNIILFMTEILNLPENIVFRRCEMNLCHG